MKFSLYSTLLHLVTPKKHNKINDVTPVTPVTP